MRLAAPLVGLPEELFLQGRGVRRVARGGCRRALGEFVHTSDILFTIFNEYIKPISVFLISARSVVFLYIIS